MAATHVARPELRIPSDDIPDGIWTVLVARGGEMIVPQPREGVVKFFSPSGRLLGSAGRRGEGPGEFRSIGESGFFGDTLWIGDPLTYRVTYVAPDRRVLRTVPFQVGVSEDGVTKAAGFQSSRPMAAYAGGILTVRTRRGTGTSSYPWAKLIDPRSEVMLRVNSDGKVLSPVLVVPPDDCSIEVSAGALRGGITIPFCSSPRVRFSQHGDRILVVTRVGSQAKPTGFQFVLVGSQGDTILQRVVQIRAIAVPARSRDSVLAKRTTGIQPELAAAYRKIEVPLHFPPYRDAILGIDGTIWVEAADQQPGHLWLAWSSSGQQIAAVFLPDNTTLHAATRIKLWASVEYADGEEEIVRYEIVRRATAKP